MTIRMVGLAWLLASTIVSPQSPEPRPLATDAEIAGTLTPGETQHYTIDLRAGDFVELRLRHATGEAEFTVVGPDDVVVREFGTFETSTRLDQPLLFIASSSGSYRVAMTLAGHVTTATRYTLHTIGPRPASDTDRVHDGCFATMVAAAELADAQKLDSLERGIGRFEEAANCWHAAHRTDMETVALLSISHLSTLFSQFAPFAAAAYERLVDTFHTSGDQLEELEMLEGSIRAHLNLGRPDRALTAAERAMALATDVGTPVQQARAQYSVALAGLSFGHYARVRELATIAMDGALRAGDLTTHGLAGYALGRLDELAGDFDAAFTRFEQVLASATPGGRVSALVVLKLGLLHLRRGELDAAEQRFQQRLAMTTNIQREQEALARLGLGDIRLARGDRRAAGALYAAAASKLRSPIAEYGCVAEERLGHFDLGEGRLAEAEARFHEMLRVGARSSELPCAAQGHAALADLAAARGDLATAEAESVTAIELNERLRDIVPNLESRALGFGAIAPAFERAIAITMQRAAQGDNSAASRAFEISERGRARALLDHVTEAALDRQRTAPDGLLRRRERLRDDWRARVAELQAAARTPSRQDRADTLRGEVTALELRLRDLDVTAEAGDDRQRQLLRPRPLSVAQIQELLDPDTQLIEYALGEPASYAWVVSSHGLRAITLPSRATIVAAALVVRDDLASAATASSPAARRHRTALAELVLVPLAGALTAPRLAIVTTGALALVPFGALPAPGRQPVEPMLARYEIVNLPSATTLAALRSLSARRPAPAKAAVMFADPIFEASDPRVRAATLRTAAATAGRAPVMPPLPRLPFSRLEATTIRALLADEATVFTDGDATRARALGDGLAGYRLVHFATHGLVNPDIAGLSSIVLSRVDRRGAAHDPFLTLADIYEMRLNAEVVVLSACSTALGKDVPGEGPIGLARAFMYAGAPRVVASLWQVNDTATAALMQRFYRAMIVDRLPAAAALRQAQQQLAALPRWASPYYWAAFVLQGDWR